MAFGGDRSRFFMTKRSVEDKNIGPLVQVSQKLPSPKNSRIFVFCPIFLKFWQPAISLPDGVSSVAQEIEQLHGRIL